MGRCTDSCSMITVSDLVKLQPFTGRIIISFDRFEGRHSVVSKIIIVSCRRSPSCRVEDHRRVVPKVAILSCRRSSSCRMSPPVQLLEWSKVLHMKNSDYRTIDLMKSCVVIRYQARRSRRQIVFLGMTHSTIFRTRLNGVLLYVLSSSLADTGHVCQVRPHDASSDGVAWTRWGKITHRNLTDSLPAVEACGGCLWVPVGGSGRQHLRQMVCEDAIILNLLWAKSTATHDQGEP